MSEWDGIASASAIEWRRHPVLQPEREWCGKRGTASLAGIWQWPEETSDECCEPTAQEIETCFKKLADEWENETGTISSIPALTSHRNYRKIIDMGWEVVPHLLIDLQKRRRFWFPALFEITGIRPFDSSDAGDGQRMLEAWVKWGQRKKLI